MQFYQRTICSANIAFMYKTAPKFLCKNYPNDSAMQWLRMQLRNLGGNGLKIIQNWGKVIFAIIALIIVLSILIWVGYKLEWTGFGTKTLWDWMQLLIIPAVLAGGAAGGAYWLNELARQREQAVTEQRAQETALQTYLDKMTELLLDKKLRESKVESEVRAVARARTLTMLRRLDKDRKGTLIQFLYEAKLIDKNNRVIDLSGADLTLAYLSGAYLGEADLSRTILYRAILRGAYLERADLSRAILRGADLREVFLSDAILYRADLSRADLNDANLSRAILRGAMYTKNTVWPEGFDPDAAGAIRVNE